MLIDLYTLGMLALTDQQAAFAVEFVANGGNATAAAKSAGYSAVSAHQLGHAMLKKPHVLAAIRAEREREIGALATVGLSVVRGILTDESDATLGARKLRLEAAKTVIAAAGHVAPKAPDAPESAAEKRFEAMTDAELEDFVRATRERLAAAAEAEAVNAPSVLEERELETA